MGSNWQKMGVSAVATAFLSDGENQPGRHERVDEPALALILVDGHHNLLACDLTLGPSLSSSAGIPRCGFPKQYGEQLCLGMNAKLAIDDRQMVPNGAGT